MYKKLITIFAAVLVITSPTIAVAEFSEFGLLAGRADRTIQFLFAPQESSTACSYALYGSRRQQRLIPNPSPGQLITTHQGSDGSLLLTAERSRALKIEDQGGGARRIYFIATKTCGGTTVNSNLEWIRIPLRRGGLTQKRWLNHLEEKLVASPLTLSNPFSDITFNRPVDFQNPGDGSDRLFVLEQPGVISLVHPVNGVPTKSTFLDISDKTEADNEQGLLGFAFHPNYASNGLFFVNYTDNSGDTVIARYHASSADDADESSEAVIFTLDQPAANHNGGGLTFGPDGLLYIALGDGGADSGNGQDRTSLFGKILRINIDSTTLGNYGIPQGNPFVGGGGGIREEIFAYGFRNPWRINWDLRRQKLWAGDVGQGTIEEVDQVLSGGNYGWDIKEGSQCYNPSNGCDSSGLIEPIAEYSHDYGSAITGGYVYRGSAVPALRGQYLFSDFDSGVLWTIPAQGQNHAVVELLETGRNISSFGQDSAGELYLLSYGDGTVQKITG